MNNTSSFVILRDGEELPLEKKYLISEENEYLFSFHYTNKSLTKIKLNFVGFLIFREEILVSFPKHYKLEKKTNYKHDLELLMKLIKLYYAQNSRLSGTGENSSLFPLGSYRKVCEYYKNFGLYFNNDYLTHEGNSGKINWKKTLKNSNKVISGNNLLFLPFYKDKKVTEESLITECMRYVLYDGYLRYGQYFKEGIYFRNYTEPEIFKHKDILIDRLLNIRARNFKDITIQLIDSLIDYIRWSSNNITDTIHVIQYFESYWESIITQYLNTHFNYSKEREEIYFKNNNNNNNIFHNLTHSIEQVKKSSHNFNVRYDHLYIDDYNKVAFLFDSKYYTNLDSLDYKQFSYYFTLLDYLYRRNLSNNHDISDYKIYNGLILPSFEYKVKSHVDTRTDHNIQHPFLQNLFIAEYYLPLKEILKWYLYQ